MSLRSFFFFNDTATTEIYTLSLHDALPISVRRVRGLTGSRGSSCHRPAPGLRRCADRALPARLAPARSEEHTSELQSHLNLVCRLLLEKKKTATELSRLRQRVHHRIDGDAA